MDKFKMDKAERQWWSQQWQIADVNDNADPNNDITSVNDNDCPNSALMVPKSLQREKSFVEQEAEFFFSKPNADPTDQQTDRLVDHAIVFYDKRQSKRTVFFSIL